MKTQAMFLVGMAILAAALPLAAQVEERAIVKKVVVKAPVEQVWQAWTTSEGVKSFFAPDAKIDAKPDGPFEVYMNPYGAPGMKGADTMKVLGVQENRMLSFTWNAPPSLAEARQQRTVVILRFKPVERGTEVTLAHIGWGEGGEWDKAFTYFDRAWGTVLGNLQKRFAEGPLDWTEWLKRLKEASEKK